MVDLATLTGASVVALGNETGALFCNNDNLLQELQFASKDSFESIWHMPITDEHREAMKGKFSDLNNIGSLGRSGGACTAAAFLERFIDKDVHWAHIDIAGPAEASKIEAPNSAEMTGFGASLLLHYLTMQR